MQIETIQVRVQRDLHRELKHEAIRQNTTLLDLSNKMIRYCLDNNINFSEQ